MLKSLAKYVGPSHLQLFLSAATLVHQCFHEDPKC